MNAPRNHTDAAIALQYQTIRTNITANFATNLQPPLAESQVFLVLFFTWVTVKIRRLGIKKGILGTDCRFLMMARDDDFGVSNAYSDSVAYNLLFRLRTCYHMLLRILELCKVVNILLRRSLADLADLAHIGHSNGVDEDNLNWIQNRVNEVWCSGSGWGNRVLGKKLSGKSVLEPIAAFQIPPNLRHTVKCRKIRHVQTRIWSASECCTWHQLIVCSNFRNEKFSHVTFWLESNVKYFYWPETNDTNRYREKYEHRKRTDECIWRSFRSPLNELLNLQL